MGSVSESTDTTEVSSSGRTASRLSSDPESGRYEVQIPFQKNKQDSPSLPSQEVSSSSTGLVTILPAEVGTNPYLPALLLETNHPLEILRVKVSTSSTIELSDATDLLKVPAQKVSASPPESSNSGLDLVISSSGTQTNESPMNPFGIVTSPENGTLPAGADDMLSSSPDIRSDNLREVGHHLREESRPSE